MFPPNKWGWSGPAAEGVRQKYEGIQITGVESVDVMAEEKNEEIFGS